MSTQSANPNTPELPALRAMVDELAEADAAGLRRRLAGPLAPGVVNVCSNDYLGLSRHPRVLEAARTTLDTGRFGAGAARLVGADLSVHRALETRLARFKRCASALLFSTGYHANVGCIAALVGPDDIVFSDALNHASIIDGCRLSRAQVRVYPHLDAEALGRELATPDARAARRRLIVTDSVFGMDGDCAPLAPIAALARRYDALTYVDEAHATGVVGPRGRGLVAATEVHVDVQVTTLGKALGCFGAAVLGPKAVTDYLINRARTFVFTTALPPTTCAAALAAVDILDSDVGDALRARLSSVTRALRTLLYAAIDSTSPIVPLHFADPHTAVAASRALLERGFFAQAIRPPTVPTSRLRFAAHAELSDDDLARLGDAINTLDLFGSARFGDAVRDADPSPRSTA